MTPELIAQLVDPTHATLSAGSNAKVAWRCELDPRHIWHASPNTRRKSGCAVCANHLVMAGINDLATTMPQLAAQLLDPADAQRVHRGSHKKAWWRCAENPAHQWQASIVARTKLKSGCPYCSGRSSLIGTDDLATTNPAIAAQLIDPAQAVGIGAGSAKKLAWQCTLNPAHTWKAAVRNRTRMINPTGCPQCAHRGDRAETRHKTLAEANTVVLRDAVDPIATGQLSLGSGKNVQWQCRMCAVPHTYTMNVQHKIRGQGCPVIAGVQVMPGFNDIATTHPDLASQLVDMNLATTLSRGCVSMVEWKCSKNHHWKAGVASRVNGNNCPICANKQVLVGFNDLASTHPKLAAKLIDPAQGRTVTAGSTRILKWQCDSHAQHRWSARVTSRMQGANCPICANKQVLAGFNDLRTTRADLAAQLLDPRIGAIITASSGERVQWQCANDADHVWETYAYQRNNTATGCPRCAASEPQKQLTAIVAALVPTAEVAICDRSVLSNRQELDILVPRYKLAIEFNGLYWHRATDTRDAAYHQLKSQAAAKVGYQLVHVWEDDWIHRQAIVIRTLAHKLHATHNLLAVLPTADPLIADRAQARKLVLGEATGKIAAHFLEKNHIQGAVVASRHFVLRDHDGTIRALLSIRSPRSNARMNREPGQWEIQRYATLGIVTAGFSRLLKHAERTLLAENTQLTEWISFSAHDISDGGMYRANGFTAEATLPADYKYFGKHTGGRRAPKEAFQRKRFRNDPVLIWDETWTEREAAAANSLNRIYDAGKTRWVRQV